MTAEEAKTLKKGDRVVARYVAGNFEGHGEIVSNDATELVVRWDAPSGMHSRAPHDGWRHLHREEKR